MTRARGIHLFVALCVTLSTAQATTYLARTEGEIRSFTGQLLAGDTLLIAPGDYTFSASPWWPSNRAGLPTDPIVIMPQSGSVRIIGDLYENVINLSNCSYLILKGLEITCSGQYSGIDGINFKAGNSHVTIQDCAIHDITNVGIGGHENASYIEIKHTHIYNLPNGLTGIYLGQHDGSVVLDHCTIVNNWIHDCPNSYGIQIKRACYANRIEDNVVYNISPARPGIMCYKTDRTGTADNNIIRGNAVWNTGEGINVVGGVDVENNVVFNSGYGVYTQNYGGWGLENLRIKNNTVYKTTGACFSLPNWDTALGEMVFINNAGYQDSLNQSAISAPQGPGAGIVSNNYYYGTCNLSQGVQRGNPPVAEFIRPSILPGDVNLYPLPASLLINNGTSTNNPPAYDFNLSTRPYNALYDVGAYEWSGPPNPGWQIREGFKEFPNVGIETNKGSEGPRVRGFKVNPNPFVSFTMAPGHEAERFNLYDISGQKVGAFPGDRIGEGLAAGVYFLKYQEMLKQVQHDEIVRIVKLR